MQGIILDYDNSTNKGIIRGDDGARYTFITSSFKSDTKIKSGLKVDFEIENTNAIDIYIIKTELCAVDILDNAKEVAVGVKPMLIKLLKLIAIVAVLVSLFALFIELKNENDRQKREEQLIKNRQQTIKQADEYYAKGQFGSAYDIYMSFGEHTMPLNEPNDPYGLKGSRSRVIFFDSSLLKKTASCLINLGKYNEAVQILIDNGRKDAELYILLGQAYLRLGDKSKAIENAKEACSRGDCSLSNQLNIK